jgi:hypothetical protein
MEILGRIIVIVRPGSVSGVVLLSLGLNEVPQRYVTPLEALQKTRGSTRAFIYSAAVKCYCAAAVSEAPPLPK